MRIGKISENVLKRSVLRKISIHREEVKNGADVGKDCAVLSFGGEDDVALATEPVSAPIGDIGDYAVYAALNNVAVSGAEPVGVMLSVLLPETAEESELQHMMERMQHICGACGVDIVGGHTEVMTGIAEPIDGVGDRETKQSVRSARRGAESGYRGQQVDRSGRNGTSCQNLWKQIEGKISLPHDRRGGGVRQISVRSSGGRHRHEVRRLRYA